MKTKFSDGALVKIVKFDDKVVSGNRTSEYGYDYYLYVYTKEGERWLINVDPDTEYFVDETSVMPIYCDDGITFYPLLQTNKTHSKKFYVPEDYLVLVDEEDEEEDSASCSSEVTNDKEEDDFDADYSQVKEFLKISCNISGVVEQLTDVIESLTTLIQKQIRG